MNVALVYVGTVVGAGFASGQEVYLFFGRHGTAGLVGIATASLGFWVLGYRALTAGRGHAGLGPFLAAAYPSGGAGVLELLMMAFLAAGLLVVAAAGGTLLSALGACPLPVGSAAILVAALAIAAYGADGMLKAHAVLVPFLVGTTLLVAVRAPGRWGAPGIHGWWLSSLLYVSYNLFTGLVVLLAMGARLPTAAERRRAAGAGAALLGLLALALDRALLGLPHAPGDLPVMEMAGMQGGAWPALYAVALLAAIVTTGAAEAFPLRERLGSRRLWWLLLIWPATLLGFQGLVAALYPVLGALAVLFWWPLLLRAKQAR